MADPQKVSDPKFPYPEENAEQKGGASIREPTRPNAYTSLCMHHCAYSMSWILDHR